MSLHILFIHDVAYCAEDLAPSLKKLYHVKSEILHLQNKSFDQLLATARYSRADIVHANYISDPALVALLSGKPFVLHAHGDDVRFGVRGNFEQPLDSALKIFYSTADLKENLPQRAEFLPRPINTEKFKPRKAYKLTEERALYFAQTNSDPRLREREADYISQCEKLAQEMGKKLVVAPSMQVTAHYMMPDLLSHFSLVFDKEFPESELSKTALEALCMEIPVWKAGKLHEEYEEIRTDYSADHVAKLYMEAMAW